MPKTVEKCVCCACGQSLANSKFYKSYSKFYIDGRLPICKDCFSSKFGEYYAEYHSSKKAMQRMCMAFDIYFDEDLFDNCDVNDDTVVGNYFRKLNMSQYRNKTFDNTISGTDEIDLLSGDRKQVKDSRVAVLDEYGNEKDSAGEIKQDDIDKWGVGFDPTDYEILNSHYRLLTSANPQSDSNREIFIVDLCYTKMQQMKAARDGRVDDYNKLTESYRKSFTQAGLKTVRDTSELEDFSIGVNAETIEKYTPAEYYKNKSLFRDYDNLGEYITRFLLRPLKNLQFGTKDRDEEFYVKDENDIDTVDIDELTEDE